VWDPRYTLYPAIRDALAIQVKETECVTVVVPVPDNEAVAGLFPALLEMVAVPFTAPLEVGENVTATEVEPPAATLNGVAALMLKPAPVTLIDETLTLAVPELESFRFCELLVPTVTFPKATEVGETLSWPIGVETPVPVNVTTFGEELKLLTIDAEPLAAPTLCGEKTTFAV